MRFSPRCLFAIGLHRLVISCSLRVSVIALFYKRLWLEVYLYNHERWRSDQWRQREFKVGGTSLVSRLSACLTEANWWRLITEWNRLEAERTEGNQYWSAISEST